MENPLIVEHFKAGIQIRNTGYAYFVPEKINRQWSWQDASLNSLLEQASIQLGRLNSYGQLVPNIDLFIHLHVTKEAVISSRIEGTQTNMNEAFLQIEDIEPERRDDWQEVQNYTDALNKAIEDLKLLPLSSRLLRQTHRTLLSGVRGEHKMPGEFRTSQNWIGGLSLHDAIFVPPSPIYVQELMGDLENFLHNDQIEVPKLVRAGIAHYQFETIHPFLDGNGRIGRLLIVLYLVSEKLLDYPLLYLSTFFEKDKSLYYDNLMRVRDKNDLLHWLKYFLVGVTDTARQASETLAKILELRNRLELEIHKNWGRRSSSGFLLLKNLFEHPIIRIKDVEKVCNLSSKAAGDLVVLFMEKKILKEFTGYSRNRIFVFEDYLALVQ